MIIFRAEFLLHFNYNPADASDEIEFVSKIDLNEKFHDFIGLSNDLYLFVRLNENVESLFDIKRIDNQSNKVLNIFKISFLFCLK